LNAVETGTFATRSRASAIVSRTMSADNGPFALSHIRQFDRRDQPITEQLREAFFENQAREVCENVRVNR